MHHQRRAWKWMKQTTCTITKEEDFRCQVEFQGGTRPLCPEHPYQLQKETQDHYKILNACPQQNNQWRSLLENVHWLAPRRA